MFSISVDCLVDACKQKSLSRNEHENKTKMKLWNFTVSGVACVFNRIYFLLSIPFMMFLWIHFQLQELPKAEALLSGREVNDDDMQSLDNKNKDAESISTKSKNSDSDSSSSSSSSSSSGSDSSFSDSDETDEMNRVQIKVPLELSLSELAHNILQQNEK